MDTTQPYRRLSAADLQADVQRARDLAHIMDSQFSIMGFQFGADALVGLVPGIGDTLALIPALYPLYVAKRHGLSRLVQIKMGKNIATDYLVGLIPVLGDIFDATFKANLKNVALLEEEVLRMQREEAKSRPLL